MGFRLLPEVEAELDDIWLYLARESGSIEIANRVIDAITERFFLLGRQPQIGRRRDHDLRRTFAVFPWANTSSSIASTPKTLLFCT